RTAGTPPSPTCSTRGTKWPRTRSATSARLPAPEIRRRSVSAIKPPGGPGGVGAPSTPDGPAGPSGPSGPSLQNRVAEQSGTAGASAAGAASSPQSVIADLRAGRITPNEALTRLTDLAVARSGAPPAMRPSVEARLREMLARDPLVQDLVRQMGAT